MNRYDRKYQGHRETQERRERFQQLLAELGAEDERERARAVRSLCPCRGPWPDTVWQHIEAAAADPSPLVRLQALHVLEDTETRPHPNAYRLLRQACQDRDPRVARAAADFLRQFRLREERKTPR